MGFILKNHGSVTLEIRSESLVFRYKTPWRDDGEVAYLEVAIADFEMLERALLAARRHLEGFHVLPTEAERARHIIGGDMLGLEAWQMTCGRCGRAIGNEVLDGAAPSSCHVCGAAPPWDHCPYFCAGEKG